MEAAEKVQLQMFLGFGDYIAIPGLHLVQPVYFA